MALDMSGSMKFCEDDDLARLQKYVANQKQISQWQWTWIRDAAAEGDAISIAKYCLGQGANVGSGVIAAVHRGQATRVYNMLSKARNLEIEQDSEIGDAFDVAVARQDPELVEFCLIHGAHPDRTQALEAPSLLGEAVLWTTIDIVKLLLKYGAKKQGEWYPASCRDGE